MPQRKEKFSDVDAIEDVECFKWCIRYHRSEQGKNESRITKLSDVNDKYNYESMEYPTSYADIYNFEKINEICILFTRCTVIKL